MKILALILALFSLPAAAEDCSPFQAVAQRGSFSVKIPDDLAKYGFRMCRVEDPALTGNPLEVIGCFSKSPSRVPVFVKAPEGITNKCIEREDRVLQVFPEDFQFQPVNAVTKKAAAPVPAAAVDCQEPVMQTMDPDVAAGMTSIFRILESDDAQSNGFKQIGHLEKYHRCLLTGKKNQYDNYVTRYRDIIENASEAFGLPMALLTCSCGRESLFDAKATSHTNVKGICQNVGASLEDVSRWINIKGSAVQKRWKRFLTLLGDKIEYKSCLRAELSQRTVEHCPSLGLGAAAVYYSYLYKEATEEESIGNASWDSKSLDTLITLAAANNVGPARVKALQGKKKDKWAKALLAETCKKDGVAKFNEVKDHMLALHSCLIDGSWLDHQGKPLAGECSKLNGPESLAKQQSARAAFAGRLLNSCK